MNVMRDPSQALATRWFQKAENDLLNVANNLKAEWYASDTVCFHQNEMPTPLLTTKPTFPPFAPTWSRARTGSNG